MALFNKSDMQYDDYQWTAYPNDNPRVTGKPDSTRFNRHEGYEVLYLINALAEEWEFKNVASCLKMETMIREKLPSDTIMQTKVKEWIIKYWNS
ncbi:hypothetical protein [Flavobacterium taihuense]|uniref:Uncharacterized protein n=1 Tax=Flavobacterium taihuense TaxID=2857508 RepID=A0ABS6XRQ1_9FLAO|nr:hypothetical protein [Flavobacterium taihuense]MBW4359352.1 hypothetical protein [Flavobacterium taihuense]